MYDKRTRRGEVEKSSEEQRSPLSLLTSPSWSLKINLSQSVHGMQADSCHGTVMTTCKH